MKLTRHARDRLRWIQRVHPAVTAHSLVEALPAAETLGYDDRGNLRARVVVGDAGITVVIDEAEGFVVTLWVR